MRKLISLSLGLILLLTACAPAAAPTATPQPEPTQMIRTPATVEPVSPTEQNPPQATKQPKGQKTPGASTSSDPNTGGKGSKAPMVVPTSTNPQFIATEITGRPTDSSITVNVVPASAMTIYYEYGTASGTYTAKTEPQSASAGAPLETLIGGLQANTRYYYRINYNGVSGSERTFVTQRAPGSTFTFDIQGDSHPERNGQQFDPALYTRTLTGAASDQPDFFMTIGDDFSVDTLKDVNPDTVRALYVNQRQWLGLVGAPVFLVNGNHEQAALANLDGTADNVAVWAQTSRNAYYPLPAPDAFYSGDPDQIQFIGELRDYYAFTWGDALFVVIDPYWHSTVTVDNTFGDGKPQAGGQKGKRDLWEITLGDTQYQWFRQTLKTSTAKYKFVFTHHVNGTGRGGIEVANSFEWGDSAHLAEHRPGWDKTIQQVMADTGVTIFFQGHDHIFVKQELDGVIYQTLPEPANPLYSWENADSYTSGDKFPNSGRVRVTVAPTGVTVEYVRSYLDKPDEVAFSYTVP